jgi:hypothetical protein
MIFYSGGSWTASDLNIGKVESCMNAFFRIYKSRIVEMESLKLRWSPSINLISFLQILKSYHIFAV